MDVLGKFGEHLRRFFRALQTSPCIHLTTSGDQRLANAGEDDSYLFFSVMKDLKAHVELRLCFAGLSFLASPSIVTARKSGLLNP